MTEKFSLILIFFSIIVSLRSESALTFRIFYTKKIFTRLLFSCISIFSERNRFILQTPTDIRRRIQRQHNRCGMMSKNICTITHPSCLFVLFEDAHDSRNKIEVPKKKTEHSDYIRHAIVCSLSRYLISQEMFLICGNQHVSLWCYWPRWIGRQKFVFVATSSTLVTSKKK